MLYRIQIDGKRVRRVKVIRDLNINRGYDLKIVTPILHRTLFTLTLCIPGDRARLDEAFVYPWAEEFIIVNNLGTKKEDGIFPLYHLNHKMIDR